MVLNNIECIASTFAHRYMQKELINEIISGEKLMRIKSLFKYLVH